MSDAIDAVAEALARNKKLAASHLVRKEELEAEIAQLRGQRSFVDDAALAQEVDARLTAATAELAQAEQGYRSALDEIAALKKLAGGARAAEARAVVTSSVSPDPVLRSDEETALDNARAHIAELGAQARLADELAGPAVAKAPPAPRSREDADAEARRAFDELRAKRQSPGAPEPPPAPEAPPKKTM